MPRLQYLKYLGNEVLGLQDLVVKRRLSSEDLPYEVFGLVDVQGYV